MMTARRLMLLACCLFASAGAVAEMDAADVMRKNFFATKISGFTGNVSMVLTNDRGAQRTRTMSIRSMLQENGIDAAVLTRFTQPADIKNTGFLQVESSAGNDDIWVYLPALGKTRRLAANNKRDSFFGTDFSYGDILLPPVEKYVHSLLRMESLDGARCYVIESKPKDPQTRNDTGYSRKVSWIDAESFVERKVEYYDTRETLLKTQMIADIREVEPDKDRSLAMQREMKNHQTGHTTLYRIDNFELDSSLRKRGLGVRDLEAR
jgi:hypothetical protein